MKKLVLMSLLIINGIVVADEEITVNLRFNNQIAGLENAVRANVMSIQQYDENLGGGEIVPVDVELEPGETHQVAIPALATYKIFANFYDAEGKRIDADIFHTKITVTESGQTIDLPFEPENLEAHGHWLS